MKTLVLVLCFALLPSAGWAAGKAPDAQMQKELEEDICYGSAEYSDAQAVFMRETGGAASSTNPYQFRLLRIKEMKEARLHTLLKRYQKRYGKEFNLLSCLSTATR